jgi:hypothetical protein
MAKDKASENMDATTTNSIPSTERASATPAVDTSIFASAIVQILPDNRVEAIIDNLNDGDEVIIRTSQKKVAAWIFNDVGAAAMKEASKIRPFEG